jgi:hypothetical protein
MMQEPGCGAMIAMALGACLLVMVIGFLFHIGWNWVDQVNW